MSAFARILKRLKTSGSHNITLVGFFYAFGAGLALSGLALAAGGAALAAKGGSPFYLASGVLVLSSGVLVCLRRAFATHLAALNFVFTWIWSLMEAGLDGWALLPRVNFATTALVLFALPSIRSRLAPDWSSLRFKNLDRRYPLMTAGIVAIATTLVAATSVGAPTAPPPQRSMDAQPIKEDWKYFGQDPGGARFSSLNQITRENAHNLKQVWSYAEPLESPQTAPHRREEATPLMADGKLFVCLGDNTIIALDAEDGRLLWRFDPHVDLTGVSTGICRGASLYENPTLIAAKAACAKRILFGTLDARLMAIDAATGTPCADFGQGGAVSLKEGMGDFPPGQFYPTSPPAISNSVAIIGGLVLDNHSTGEPSGVIRAYDAQTGKFAWAWDMGRPSEAGMPTAPATFTRGTPNAWSIFSADDALGLVYIPTGNATPDFVGSYRRPEWEKYSSSVVALDTKTGAVRWTYQFTHHDLWDYDTSAQPILFEMPTSSGRVPALLQATKLGQIFVLDRRTGAPLLPVEEQPVPQTDVPGEWTAKTQPFSIGMPTVSGPPLKEADMWGLSPFDMLLCRIKLHRLRYDGPYTPPSLRGSITYPGQMGGVDWGSLSVDSGRDLLIAPSVHLATVAKLVRREDADRGARVSFVQSGTPYAADNGPLMTALGVPCQEPPFADLTGIDLRTRKIVWRRAIGTAEDLGPFGIALHLPFTIGAPPIVGGPVTTAGDVTFIGAAGDRRLRAIDSLTGKVLWSQKLPVGNQATPITYRAPRSGRQMVAIVSGAYYADKIRLSAATHVVAYALH